jgi:hypothetical protein
MSIVEGVASNILYFWSMYEDGPLYLAGHDVGGAVRSSRCNTQTMFDIIVIE